MEYEYYNSSNKDEVDSFLSSSNAETISKVIVGMVNGVDDWEWLQVRLLALVNSEDFWIAKNAITGLGDVARIHKSLDKQKVIKELNSITRKELQPILKTTLDDIRFFLK